MFHTWLLQICNVICLQCVIYRIFYTFYVSYLFYTFYVSYYYIFAFIINYVDSYIPYISLYHFLKTKRPVLFVI